MSLEDVEGYIGPNAEGFECFVLKANCDRCGRQVDGTFKIDPALLELNEDQAAFAESEMAAFAREARTRGCSACWGIH